jgi:hypothetical protein
MGSIMLIVAVSRGLAVPQYLAQLNVLTLSDTTVNALVKISFVTMCFGLSVGAVIILGSMWKAVRASSAAAEEKTPAPAEVTVH